MTSETAAPEGALSTLAPVPQGALPDTIVMVAARDAVDIIYAVAAGSFILIFLVLVAALFGLHLQVRSAIRAIDRARAALLRDEAIEKLRLTAGHVEAMVSSARDETERLAASVAKVSDQVALASHRMEERIEEFNALMEVVQEEVEEIFLDTASTARGVRAGFGEIARERARDRVRDRREGVVAPPRDVVEPLDDEEPEGEFGT